jgi:hypothetical protein
LSRELLDPERELQFLISGWLHIFGHPPTPTPFTYQLECTLDDIRSGRFNPQPNSPFNTTIARNMKLQANSHPMLKVPRILVELRGVLERDRNLALEGIFRISPNKIELDETRKRIEKGEYDLRGVSGHCAAALIKEWLRSLSEPLLPERLYGRAIQVAKLEIPADAPEHQNPLVNGAAELFRELDAVNQEVLIQLAEICGNTLRPEFQATNKMSLEALSIVLSPCILRNPENDPTLMLANVKFETKFCAALIKAVINQRQ